MTALVKVNVWRLELKPKIGIAGDKQPLAISQKLAKRIEHIYL